MAITRIRRKADDEPTLDELRQVVAYMEAGWTYEKAWKEVLKAR